MDPLPPKNLSPRPSANSRLSSIRQYASPRRYWLCGLAIVMVLVMVIGVIFAAHHYYHDFGGQGFLKFRSQLQGSHAVVDTHVFLPLRQVELWPQSRPILGRSPEDLPYFTCGDQQNSCESLQQPDICCPVGSICYPAGNLTPSGIFCCNGTAWQCQADERLPPRCPTSTVECGYDLGGGCCPGDSICSPNGCIRISSPSIISESFTNSTTSAIQISTSKSPTMSPLATTTTSTAPVLSTTTVTEAPAATVTTAKDGEEAQSGVGTKGSIMRKFCLSYSTAWVLVCVVAAVMGML